MKYISNTRNKIGNKWYKRGEPIPSKHGHLLGPLVLKGDVTEEREKAEPVRVEAKHSVGIKTMRKGRGKK